MPQFEENRIFLCHASEDKPKVIEVYRKLKAAGLHPWLDKMDLLPGQYWDQEIQKALRQSRFIIIFFSSYSVSKRGYVQREFKLALDTLQEIPGGQIFIIPVRLDACTIPDRFSHIHHVDLYEPEGFDLVLKAIQSKAKKESRQIPDTLYSEPKGRKPVTKTPIPEKPHIPKGPSSNRKKWPIILGAMAILIIISSIWIVNRISSSTATIGGQPTPPFNSNLEA